MYSFMIIYLSGLLSIDLCSVIVDSSIICAGGVWAEDRLVYGLRFRVTIPDSSIWFYHLFIYLVVSSMYSFSFVIHSFIE